MLAAFRIIAGVVVYRLRKLEMANLAAAGSIAVALHLSIPDIAIRTLYCFVLNALVYLNNDYIDVQIDLNSADKDASKARFLADNRSAALWAQWILVAALALFALLYDSGLLVPLVAGGGICWWYSAKLKRMPFVDVLAMMIWGVAMPLCGTPMTNTLGLFMALQLGLFSGVFETIQVMRDADEDAAEEGVRTTGVVLGKERSLVLARVLMVASSIYALLFLQPWAAGVSLLALFVPFAPDQIERYWTRVKLVCGVAWLIVCAWVFFYGQRAGLLG
jgi:4-hydroxybenzoate polyprenyltransferase